MAMRIGSVSSGYYDPGKVNPVEKAQRVDPVEKVSAVKGTDRVQELSGQEKASVSRENPGIIQTRVSHENSYQRAVVSDPSYAFDRMAMKLMDKLPQILEDMKNLPETESFDAALSEKKEKVIISEDGRMRGQAAQPPETEDFPL